MSKNHYIYIFFYSMKERKCLNSINLWNCEGLETKNFVRLCATLHTIQSLLVLKNASHCSTTLKTMSRRFYDIIKWLLCLPLVAKPLKLKGVFATFLLVCFLSLNKSTSESRKNAFRFTSKTFFVLEKIKF